MRINKGMVNGISGEEYVAMVSSSERIVQGIVQKELKKEKQSDILFSNALSRLAYANYDITEYVNLHEFERNALLENKEENTKCILDKVLTSSKSFECDLAYEPYIKELYEYFNGKPELTFKEKLIAFLGI